MVYKKAFKFVIPLAGDESELELTMKDGNYQVHFSTPYGGSGVGMVKVADGVIHGADAGFLYTGKTQDSNGRVEGQIEVLRHAPFHRSLFGHVEKFEFQFSGVSTEDSFNLSGNVLGRPELRVGIVGWLKI